MVAPGPLTPDALAPIACVALIATAGAGAPAVVLHVALRHAMRARGLGRWRLADTLLVSPLLFLGLFTAFAALAYGVGSDHVAGPLAAAAGAFVVAGFGARAIGKLY